MPTRRAFLKWTGGALGALGIQGGARTARAHALVPLAVVVARNSPIERLSRFELKRLYLGATLRAPGGERILAFHQAYPASDRVAFEREALDMESEQLARYWVNRRIRGESGAPRVVGSVDLLHQVLGRLAQSVGYVRVDQVGPELRVIPIDGLLPGDPGYLVALDEGAESFG